MQFNRMREQIEQIRLEKEQATPDFLQVPEAFLTKETRTIFNNFQAIMDGTFKQKGKVRQKETHLQRKMEWTQERVGDYLGPKVPSLLEFLENRIHLREVMGVSMFENSGLGPKHKAHVLLNKKSLEESLENQMKIKDLFHSNVQFKSDEAD